MTATLAKRNGHRPTTDQAQAAVTTLLTHLGYDPSCETLADTPARVVRALVEMTAGQNMDPAAILSRVFPAHLDADHDEVIAVTGVEFASICEHHLMPFTGTCTVAYIPQPGAPVVGLSKLARLTDIYARRLTMQERMTRQITNALDKHLRPQGAACIVRSRHACMGLRGALKPDAEMVTSSLTGLFRTDPKARSELMALATH